MNPNLSSRSIIQRDSQVPYQRTRSMSVKKPSEPTITVAHDYLTQRGGAERVALTLARELGAANIVTALYEPDNTFPGFTELQIQTSPLQKLRTGRHDPRLVMPLLPWAWSNLTSYSDITICSSSGWAHAIRTKPGSLKMVYCHNPARWLYQPEDYFGSKWQRAAFALPSQLLKTWDKRHAQTANIYVANSEAVATRIEEQYQRRATVIHPPITIDPSGRLDPDPTCPPGFWLTVARPKRYKNVDLLIEAFSHRPQERLVVVGRANKESKAPPPNVAWLGTVTDARLRWLYTNARALISASYEDFGLTPLEANAFGTPTLLLRGGGHLDSMREGISGSWIQEATARSIMQAVDGFGSFDSRLVRNHANEFSPKSFASKLLNLVDQAQVIDITDRPDARPSVQVGTPLDEILPSPNRSDS